MNICPLYSLRNFLLFAAPPQIVISPGNSSVEAGNTIILSCAGFGDPIPSVTWNMGSIQLSNSSQITIYTEVVTEVGFDFVHSILEVCNVDEATSGEYSCTVGNVFGDASVNFGIGGKNEGGFLLYVCGSTIRSCMVLFVSQIIGEWVLRTFYTGW